MRFYEGPSKDGLYSLPTLVFASSSLSHSTSSPVYVRIYTRTSAHTRARVCPSYV